MRRQVEKASGGRHRGLTGRDAARGEFSQGALSGLMPQRGGGPSCPTGHRSPGCLGWSHSAYARPRPGRRHHLRDPGTRPMTVPGRLQLHEPARLVTLQVGAAVASGGRHRPRDLAAPGAMAPSSEASIVILD
jgi:hypothetical protein